jgi:hypothetical protein
MKIPDKTEPFLWGVAAGAAALALVGFNWGGWVTGSTAQQLAGTRAEEATLAALTPICVAQFKKSGKQKARLAALKEIDSWQQGEYVSKGGWATMPGSTAEPSRELASACAAEIAKLAA